MTVTYTSEVWEYTVPYNSDRLYKFICTQSISHGVVMTTIQYNEYSIYWTLDTIHNSTSEVTQITCRNISLSQGWVMNVIFISGRVGNSLFPSLFFRSLLFRSLLFHSLLFRSLLFRSLLFCSFALCSFTLRSWTLRYFALCSFALCSFSLCSLLFALRSFALSLYCISLIL